MNTTSINRGNASLSEHPYLELNHEQQEQLQQLGSAMKKMYEEHRYVMVRNVRQFGKVVEDQKKWVEKINTEDETLTACAGTIATVIASEDVKKGKNTVDALAQAQEESSYNRTMASISVSPKAGEKFWTAGLNAPIAVLHQLATENDIPLDAIIIANQTHDVEIDSDALTQIAEILKRGELPTTVRVTPGVILGHHRNKEDGISSEVLERKKDRLIEVLVLQIEQIANKEIQSFDREMTEILLTLDRNTLGFWRLSDLLAFNGFHPASNAFLGMEDTRGLASELLQIYEKSGSEGVRTELQNRLKKENRVEYHDARIDALGQEGALQKDIDAQCKKVKDELGAVLKQMNPSNPHSLPSEGPVVPEQEMDFSL